MKRIPPPSLIWTKTFGRRRKIRTRSKAMRLAMRSTNLTLMSQTRSITILIKVKVMVTSMCKHWSSSPRMRVALAVQLDPNPVDLCSVQSLWLSTRVRLDLVPPFLLLPRCSRVLLLKMRIGKTTTCEISNSSCRTMPQTLNLADSDYQQSWGNLCPVPLSCSKIAATLSIICLR